MSNRIWTGAVRMAVPAVAGMCALSLAGGTAIASAQPGTNHGGGSSGSSSSTSFSVSLATTTVEVDNWSSYTQSQLTPLIQYADRSMATTDPLSGQVAGEMENGDRVVVTEYGIYWLDIVRRGGLLSGIWPIASGASGPNFQYMPSGGEWEPNALLPGSAAVNAAIYDAGQSVLVLPTGGTDGSCSPGHGTFVIGNSDNCNIADGPATTSVSISSAAPDHYYTFKGTLYQEGTSGDTMMVDASGHRAKIAYTLTYDFRDYSDTATDYGSANGTDAQRVLTTVTLTPSANIDLGTLVVGNDSDQGGISYPYRSYDYSNINRTYFYPSSSTPCGPSPVPGGTMGQICEGAPAPDQWLSELNKLPTTLSPGNFVTEKQTATIGDTTDRELTVVMPVNGSYRMPERIDHLWNHGLDVSSMGIDYFNQESLPVAKGASVNLGFELQTVPFS